MRLLPVAVLAAASLAACARPPSAGGAAPVAVVRAVTAGGALPVDDRPPPEGAPRDDGEEEQEDVDAADRVRPWQDGSIEQRDARAAIRAPRDAVFRARGARSDRAAHVRQRAVAPWWEASGEAWLDAYVDLEQRRVVDVPASPRKTLTLESAPKDHPLRPLLCPASGACASESAGWLRRSEGDFTLLAERFAAPEDETKCERDAKKEPRADRHATWRSCIERLPRKHHALPLGRFEAPVDGWLVMTSEGGRSCTEVRAYDLATGSAYRVNGCGASTEIGRVPLGALREAAWSLLLAGEAETIRDDASYAVPETIAIGRPRGLGFGFGHGSFSWSCGSVAAHAWGWLRDRSGTLAAQHGDRFVGRGPNDVWRRARAARGRDGYRARAVRRRELLQGLLSTLAVGACAPRAECPPTVPVAPPARPPAPPPRAATIAPPPTRAGEKLRVLCIGAHPDDPETACGGTLARYAEAGHDVHVLYMTKGELGIVGKTPAEAGAIRAAEAEEACKALGAKAHFFGHPAGAITFDRKTADELVARLDEIAPDVVLGHWPIDTEYDHQIVAALTLHAWLAKPRWHPLYMFEVESGTQTLGFVPHAYVEISGQLPKKLAAIRAHKSQDVERRAYEHHHEPMERFRAREIAGTAAEAYAVLSPEARMGSLPGL